MPNPAMLDGAAGDSKYMYAGTRMHTPDRVTVAPASKNFQIHQWIMGSPNYETHNWRFFLPGFYTKSDGSVPSEIVAPNAMVYQGLSINIGGSVNTSNGTITGGTWYSAKYQGATTWTIDPATNEVGILLDALPVSIPPNTTFFGRLAFSVSVGESLLNGWSMRTGLGESTKGAASSLVAALTDGSSLGHTGGIQGFGPSFAVAQSTGRRNRPVFQIFGDSITFGSNENQTAASTRGVIGWAARGLDDNTNARRYAYGMHAVPGLKPSEWNAASAASRRLAGIALCPNIPFTHILSGLGTNAVANADYRQASTGMRALMQAYFTWVKARWSGIPIYQSELTPRPASSDGYTTLGNQTFADDSQKWYTGDAATVYAGHPNATKWQFNLDVGGQQGNADITAYFPGLGLIDGSFAAWKAIAYDTSSNRDKWAIPGFATTLAANHTGGTAAFSLTASPTVGDVLVFGATGADLSIVTVVTGAGPYATTVSANVSNAYSSGDAATGIYPSDSTGQHPGTAGHKLIAAALETQKVTWGLAA